jgi:hypothetical protein
VTDRAKELQRLIVEAEKSLRAYRQCESNLVVLALKLELWRRELKALTNVS